MATPRKIEGTHRSLGRLVCDRCGHKTSLDRIGHSAMKEHLAAKHPQAAAAEPAKETAPDYATLWADLRTQITRDITIEQEHGDGFADLGTIPAWDKANQHWGKAEALREVLASMDREDGQPTAGPHEHRTEGQALQHVHTGGDQPHDYFGHPEDGG